MVHQGGFSVVYVRYDGYISDFGHEIFLLFSRCKGTRKMEILNVEFWVKYQGR